MKGIKENKAFLLHDRLMRQRAAEHLKASEDQVLLLMEATREKDASSILKNIDRLRIIINSLRNDLEFSSSSIKLLGKEQVVSKDAIIHMVLTSELMLIECKNVLKCLQEANTSFYIQEEDFKKLLIETRKSLQNIQSLRLIHNDLAEGSIVGTKAFEKLSEKYVGADIERLSGLSQEEGIDDWENRLYTDVGEVKKPILTRFFEYITKKPSCEKEISEVIFKIAERTKARTGGLLRLSDLYLEVKRAKPQSDISIVDLEKVVAILQKDGVIPGLRQIFAVKYIELVPLTLTEDQNIILEIAAQSYELSIEKIILKTKWPAERIQRALNGMENLGIAVYQVSSRKWVFPAFITNDKS